MKIGRLFEGDSRDSLRAMADRGEFVHSVVTDPPYGLTSVVKRFGKEGSKAAQFGKDGAFARASRGFMGQTWDGSAIEQDPDFWRLVFNIMLPGAYIVAFSGSRTYHLMATAIEQAGFTTHPLIGWAYGSGMPKATRTNIEGMDGWRYGGQVRKPALEPIYVGMKPFSEKTGRLNILKHGVGAVNIDACRVPASDGLGRWPANLIHDGSDDVLGLFPDGGSAARFFESYPFEDEPILYYPKASKEDRAGTSHPTVKPVALIRSLIRHVTPPGGIVLDPFAGSGTTGQAAIAEKMRFILMEQDETYCADIMERLGMMVRLDTGETIRAKRQTTNLDFL